MSYGQKSDSDMLLSYGFMPAPMSNPHNACNLRLGLRHDDPNIDLKRQLLQRAGQPDSMEFPLRLDALPQSLLRYAEYVVMPTPELQVCSSCGSRYT